MNIVTRDEIDISFRLLVEAVNKRNKTEESIFYYKFEGMIEGLCCANILSDKAYDFLLNAAWEVYFNGNNNIFFKECEVSY